MTQILHPILEQTRHYYPVLATNIFDWRNGGLVPRVLRRCIGHYLSRHILRDATKKQGDALGVVESLCEKISRPDRDDVLDLGGKISAITDVLKEGKSANLHMGLVNVTLELKRFGHCLGIRALDAQGHVHNDATSILEQMTTATTGSEAWLLPFVGKWSIAMERYEAYGPSTIEVCAELATAARYIPDVVWKSGEEVDVADALYENYIYGTPVEVGMYHGIPVCMQITFGTDTDSTWRRGSVRREETSLVFSAPTFAEKPHIHYILRTFEQDSSGFGKATLGIDYENEQRCLRGLAKILLNGFRARDTAEMIVDNPTSVEWRDPAIVASSSATSAG